MCATRATGGFTAPICYDPVSMAAPMGRETSFVGKKSRAKKPVAAAAARPTGELEGLIAFIQQLMREQRHAEALRAGRALVENHPLSPLAHAVLGSVLAQFNNTQESLRQFELAERLGMSDDPMILQSIAVTASAARYPIHAL